MSFCACVYSSFKNVRPACLQGAPRRLVDQGWPRFANTYVQRPSVESDSASSWTVACQAPLSMGVSRQEYWSEWTFSSPGDLPDPGIKPTSLAPSALAGGFFTISTIWEAIQLAKHAMKENRYTARRKQSQSTSPAAPRAARQAVYEHRTSAQLTPSQRAGPNFRATLAHISTPTPRRTRRKQTRAWGTGQEGLEAWTLVANIREW